MNYTTEQKATVVGMRKGGKSAKEISAELSIPLQSVYSVLRRHSVSGTVETLQRPGRPKSLSDRDVRTIVRTSKSNRRSVLMDLSNMLPVKVSRPTIRKALASQGVYSCVAAKKPFLTDVHRQRRLEFAKKYKSYTIEDWKKVIWTDESSFEIGKNSRQIRYGVLLKRSTIHTA